MSDTNYDVGDVLWVIRSDRPGMNALQIQEVITKRTMKGEDVQYLVATPGKSNPFLLHTVPGRLFQSIEEAKDVLYKQATDAIDSIIDKVQAQASESFGIARKPIKPVDGLDFIHGMAQATKTTKAQSVQTFQKDLIPEEGYEIVEMDGQQVKVKLPDSLG